MQPETKSAIHIPRAAAIAPAQDHPARPVASTARPCHLLHTGSSFNNPAAAKSLDHPAAKKLEERLLLPEIQRFPLTRSKPPVGTLLADRKSSSRRSFCSHSPQWTGLAATPARSTPQTHRLDLASCHFPANRNRQQPPQLKTESRLAPRGLVEHRS